MEGSSCASRSGNFAGSVYRSMDIPRSYVFVFYADNHLLTPTYVLVEDEAQRMNAQVLLGKIAEFKEENTFQLQQMSDWPTPSEP